MTTKFSKHLKDARLEARKTQGQVADALGFTTSFYSALEVGKKAPAPNTVTLLADYFDFDASANRLFHSAAAESIEQIRLNLQGAKPQAQEVALSLARRFDSLDDATLKELRAILND